MITKFPLHIAAAFLLSTMALLPSVGAQDLIIKGSGELIVNGAVGLHICGKDFLHIEHVYLDTPAWKAGIRKGDLLISVDGIPVQGLTVSEITGKIRGDNGTKVTVEVESAATHQRMTVELTRTAVHIKSDS